MNKNLIILALLGVGIYFIFFRNKDNNQVQKVADTIPDPIGKSGGCGCGKKKAPQIAPEL